MRKRRTTTQDEGRWHREKLGQGNSAWFRLRAVAVHLYTASGAVLAFLILVAAYNSEAVKALWLMLAALLIDSTDGLLVRRRQVKEALPSFDGAHLIDALNLTLL